MRHLRLLLLLLLHPLRFSLLQKCLHLPLEPHIMGARSPVSTCLLLLQSLVTARISQSVCVWCSSEGRVRVLRTEILLLDPCWRGPPLAHSLPLCSILFPSRSPSGSYNSPLKFIGNYFAFEKMHCQFDSGDSFSSTQHSSYMSTVSSMRWSLDLGLDVAEMLYALQSTSACSCDDMTCSSV